MRRALVTGGSGDIGAAICRRLAADGMAVLVHANRNLARAEAIAAEIRAGGGEASACRFDVTDTEASARGLGALLEEGPIQVVVNNAGVHADAPLAGMRPEQWRAPVEVSLNGFFNVTQPLLLPMMATRWGRVVAISSIAGVMGNRGQANYAAAKAGLHGAVKSLAIELASRGITANAVAPGVIEGQMSAQAFDAAAVKQLVPMKRAGRPQEVAAVVAFLVSDEAAYVSGQVIGVNGAMA